jgi:putative NADH-flavin reductase
MHFLILGASGRTGKLATAEALDRGHTVTALVRKASSMEPRQGLTIVQGTPESQTDIERALAKHPVDAALVLLNAARASDSPFAKPITPEFFLRDCVRNLTAAMSQSGRIIIMSGFGVGSSIKESSWVMKLIFWYTNMKFQMRDHEVVDQEIRSHDGLEWTLVRPPMLKEGGLEPIKEYGETGKGLWLFSGITRASVAKFMVEEVEQGRYKKQAIVIAN